MDEKYLAKCWCIKCTKDAYISVWMYDENQATYHLEVLTISPRYLSVNYKPDKCHFYLTIKVTSLMMFMI